MQAVEEAIVRTAIEVSLHDWLSIVLFASISAVSSLAVACRDRQYRDLAHLGSIAAVGGFMGFATCCYIAHMRGGVAGVELLLGFASPLIGIFGRLIEKPLYKKLSSILGVEVTD